MSRPSTVTSWTAASTGRDRRSGPGKHAAADYQELHAHQQEEVPGDVDRLVPVVAQEGGGRADPEAGSRATARPRVTSRWARAKAVPGSRARTSGGSDSRRAFQPAAQAPAPVRGAYGGPCPPPPGRCGPGRSSDPGPLMPRGRRGARAAPARPGRGNTRSRSGPGPSSGPPVRAWGRRHRARRRRGRNLGCRGSIGCVHHSGTRGPGVGPRTGAIGCGGRIAGRLPRSRPAEAAKPLGFAVAPCPALDWTVRPSASVAKYPIDGCVIHVRSIEAHQERWDFRRGTCGQRGNGGHGRG